MINIEYDFLNSFSELVIYHVPVVIIVFVIRLLVVIIVDVRITYLHASLNSCIFSSLKNAAFLIS